MHTKLTNCAVLEDDDSDPECSLPKILFPSVEERHVIGYVGHDVHLRCFFSGCKK